MPIGSGDVSANVNVGGDVSGLRGALDEGRSRLASFANDARGALGRIDSAMSELGSSLASLKETADQFRTALGFIGAGGAAAGLIAAYRQVAQSAKEWADAGEQARRRGVTVEFMSELRYAAEELGTRTGVVNDAMDKFRVRMTEVKAEGSKTAEALKALNEPLYNALRSAPDQKSALVAVAEAIRNSGNAAQQAEIATALFGDANISMIHVLSQGQQGLETWAKAARDAGVVMDTGTAESAKNLTHALDLLDRSPLWQSIEQKMIGFARNMAVIVGGSKEAMLDDELANGIEVTTNQLKRLEEALAAGAKAGDDEVGALDQIKGWAREQVNVFGRENFGKELVPYDPAAAIRVQIEEAKQRLAELKSLQDARKTEAERKDAIDLRGANTGGEGGAGETAAPDFKKSQAWLDQLHKQTLTSTQQMFAAVEAERDLDLRKLEEYLADGTIRTEDAARARFEIEAKYDAEVRKLRDKSIQPFVQAISGDLDRVFGEWIEKGKISWQQLANSILADIAKIAMRQAILEPLFGGGTTGGTGIVGTAISGLTTALQFHDGGLVGGPAVARMVSAGVFDRAPRMHSGGIAGLKMDEVPTILQKGEIVLPKGRAGGQGGPNITFNVSTPDAGSFRRSEGQISAMLTRAVAHGQRNM